MLSRGLWVFLLWLLAVSCGLQSADAADKVFILKQVQDEKTVRTVCVGDDGIKFVQGEMAIIASAPEWKVIHLNLKMKTYFETPSDKFTGVSWLDKIPGKVEANKNQVEEKIAGVKVDSLSCGTGEPGSGLLTVKTSEDIPLKAENLALIRTVFGQHRLEGLPLSINKDKPKEGRGEILKTDWCITKQIPGKFFSIPKGYTQAKSLAEVESPKEKSLKRVRKYRPFQKQKVGT